MADKEGIIRERVILDMFEGVIIIGLDGVITSVNPAAEEILEKSPEQLVGKRFARAFFEYEENDAFNQAILDAIYDSGSRHSNFVPYYTGRATKQLHISTSFLRDGDEHLALIAVLNDISELAELRDALTAMERIKALNGQLEMRNKLLSETFGRFLSDDIVRQLLETPDGLALGGKKRRLTIMMSDLRGFTALSERMGAQELIHLLNHYLGEMTEIIQRNAGTIIEFIGDGIMAIFGAPAPSEKHETEAVQAAVEMQAAMAGINAWNTAHGYPALEMGIGIHTGEVIVGNIGSEKRTKYGVVGSSVNLTGRIESYTVGGEILISPSTRAAITETLDIADERRVLPKGVPEPLVLSCVAGIGGLSCRRAEERPLPLREPAPVLFQTIRDKHIDQAPKSGAFTALSPTEALLQTDYTLERFDNLEMELAGMTQIFAKVLSREDGVYLLRFTSLPDSFASWASDLDYKN